jgi:bla regulator protein blaR1
VVDPSSVAGTGGGCVTSILRWVAMGGFMLLLAAGESAMAQDSGATEVPAWVTAAGGHAEFEVASVREDPAKKYASPNYSLDSDDGGGTNYDGGDVDYSGIFRADLPLGAYICFAYKLSQLHPMFERLPDWATAKNFAVEARVPGKPTRDQLRLMMRSLLEERFGLKLHFETREMPVLLMTLAAPGKKMGMSAAGAAGIGTGLRLHSDGPPCNVQTSFEKGAAVTFEMFPCVQLLAFDRPDHTMLVGARNTTMGLMTAFFSNIGKMRPIVDRTGIKERVDFLMLYVRDARGVGGVETQQDAFGDTFEEAVKKQLGLKMEAGRAGVAVPVVDRVEMPSGN